MGYYAGWGVKPGWCEPSVFRDGVKDVFFSIFLFFFFFFFCALFSV